MKREDIEQAILSAHRAGDFASAEAMATLLAEPATHATPASAPEIPKMLPASGKRSSAATGADAGADAADFTLGNLNEGIAQLLGFPVYTAANVIDMVKAAGGTLQGVATGKPPSPMFDPMDRSKVPFSGEAISNAMRGAGVINPEATDPTSPGGAIAAGALRAMPSVLAGGRLGPGQAAKQLGAAGISGAAAAAAGVAGADPATQMVAGMTPSMGPHALVPAKNAIRGKLTGGANVRQNIADAQRAGVSNPDPAAVTGSRAIGLGEGTIARLPGAGSVMDAAAEKRAAGMQGKVGEVARDLVPGGPVGAERSGAAVTEGVKGAVAQFRSTQDRLYRKVDEVVDPQQPISLANFRAALRKFANPTPGAEATSRQLVPPKVAALFDAVETDLAAVAAKPKTDPNAPLPAELEPMPPMPKTPEAVGGYLQAVQARRTKIDQQRAARDKAAAAEAAKPPEAASTNITRRRDASIEKIERETPIVQPAAEEGRAAKEALPYSTVSGLRSQLGRLLESDALLVDAPKSMYRALYRALSDDVRGSLPQQAKQAWERASRYTRAGHDRIDTVYQPLIDKQTPEKALKAAFSGTREGSSAFRKIMGALTPDQRNAVASHVIENMGLSAPSQQTAEGQRFSVETFLTNYNKLEPSARRALFPGARTQADIETIAKVASSMREAGRGTHNPSGTARAVTHAGFAGAGVTGVLIPLMSGHFGMAAATAGGLAGEAVLNYRMARAISSPEFLHWLAEGTKAPAADVPRYAARLAVIAKNTRDPETAMVLQELADELGTAASSGAK